MSTPPSVPAESMTTAGAADLLLLAEKAPDAYRALLEQDAENRRERRHLRRLAWADLITQTLGNLSGIIALSILAAVAWHALDQGAATQAAAIICTGAVSIVAVFVTGRLTNERSKNYSNSRNEISAE
jgi:hypothetical protein